MLMYFSPGNSQCTGNLNGAAQVDWRVLRYLDLSDGITLALRKLLRMQFITFWNGCKKDWVQSKRSFIWCVEYGIHYSWISLDKILTISVYTIAFFDEAVNRITIPYISRLIISFKYTVSLRHVSYLTICKSL